jgi:hypothetical protein
MSGITTLTKPYVCKCWREQTDMAANTITNALKTGNDQRPCKFLAVETGLFR